MNYLQKERKKKKELLFFGVLFGKVKGDFHENLGECGGNSMLDLLLIF